jgi:glutaredoxin
MEIKVFSRQSCPNCKAVKDGIRNLLSNSNFASCVKVTYYDVDSEKGLAESAYRDVRAIPTTILEDGKKEIARWDGTIPKPADLAAHASGKHHAVTRGGDISTIDL